MYAFAVIAAGILAGVRLAGAAAGSEWRPAPAFALGILCISATALSVTYRGFLPSSISHQIGTSFAYALFFLASPAEVALVLLASTFADWALNHRRPLTTAFNAGQLMVSLSAAVELRGLLAPEFTTLGRADGATMAVAVLSLAAFSLVNHGLTSAVVNLANQQPLFRIARASRIGVLNETFCVVSGLGMAVLWEIRPPLFLLGAVPVFLIVVLLMMLGRRERDLDLRRSELASLHDFGFEIGGELDAERLQEGVVRVATEALQSTGALLCVLDEERTGLRVVAHQGLAADPPESLSLAGLSAALDGGGQVLALADFPASRAEYPALRFLNAVGVLCAPVLIRSRVEGLLVLFHDSRRRPFDDEDSRRLETLLRFVNMALSNGRLVAELKGMQAQLLQTEKLSALGMLVSGVAHELNNPLTSVVGYAQLLLTKEPDAERRRMLGRVASEASRAGRIVQNLLTFSRKHKSEKKLTDVNAVLDQVLDLRSYEMRVGNIDLVRRLSPSLPPVLVDPHQIQQVFLNLLTNAEHAVRTVPRKGRITVETRLRDGMVRLAVMDNGSGIAPGDLGKVFVPFFTTKEIGKGTGLGLSICYGIVQDHGGRIDVESRFGEGTAFLVDIPAATPSEQATVEASPETLPPPAFAGAGHLLVVDDEESIADLVRDVLETHGWRVSAARDGSEALRLVATNRFDVFLVDMKMPGMDGPAFYRALHESRPELARRVVFSTGDAASEGTIEFLQDAGAAVLDKPYNVSSLLETISRIAEQESRVN